MAAKRLYRELLEELTRLEALKLVTVPQLLIEVAEAREAAQRLTVHRVDGLLCVSGTFHGLAHHAAAVYGEYVRPFELLVKLKGWELFR
jgi:hypothetical protein